MDIERIATEINHEYNGNTDWKNMEYWCSQVRKYLRGERGYGMHDAALIYMSREYPEA